MFLAYVTVDRAFLAEGGTIFGLSIPADAPFLPTASHSHGRSSECPAAFYIAIPIQYGVVDHVYGATIHGVVTAEGRYRA